MKKNLVCAVSAILMFISLSSCNSNASTSAGNDDTARRTSADTAVIPGTPGPSGSQPGPGDTTQSHRDSLKRVRHLDDSAK